MCILQHAVLSKENLFSLLLLDFEEAFSVSMETKLGQNGCISNST